MLDQIEDSPRMLQERNQSEPATQQPMRTLDYEPPAPRRLGEPSVWLGIAPAFFVSLGVGFAVFGLMMASGGVRDEFAAATGFGFGSFVLGLMLAGLYWLRRGREH